MRPILLLAFLSVFKWPDPPAVSLSGKGSVCAGSDTLIVHSSVTPASITWLNGSSVAATAVATLTPYGVTVAGGNGVGSAANQLSDPLGIYVDASGDIYIADVKNNRVVEWAPGATGGVTVAGSGAGLNQPVSVFVDAGGFLYVTDAGNNRVQRFPPGSTAASLGQTVAGGNGSGAGATQFASPQYCVVDAAGYLYVADPNNHRVQKFPPGSTALTPGITVVNTGFPNCLFVDGSGDLYVSDDDGSVWKWPPGATAGILVAGGNGLGSAANQLVGPMSIYVDASGNVYVSDQFNNRIQLWAPGATSGVTVAGGNGFGAAANQLALPEGLFLDAWGEIYTSDDFSRVQKWEQYPVIDSTYIATTPGTYTATVTYADGSVTTNAIVVNPVLTPAVSIGTSAGTFCEGSVATFTATPVNGGADPVYQWQVNGMDAGTGGATYSSNSLANGDVVSCELTSGVACPSPASVLSNPIPMVVNPLLVPSVTVAPPAKVCFGIPATFSAAALNGGAAPVYQWQVNGANVGADSPTFTSDAFTTGDVVACRVTSDATCVTAALAEASSSPVTVYVPITPVVTISASTTAVCAGDTVSFVAAVTDGGVLPTYQWEVNGVDSGGDSPDFSWNQFENGDVVRCQYTGNGGCGLAHSNPIPVVIYPLPSVTTGPPLSITEGQSVTLTPQVTGDIAVWSWSPDLWLSDSSIADPAASSERSTVYTLTVTSVNGCKGSGSQAVTVYGKLRVPNAFTPNGDGKNDIFYILGGPAGSRIRNFAVYNRWGQEVFQVHDAAPDNPAFGWNGNYHGTPAPAGAYVYIINMDLGNGVEQEFRGTVVLVR